MSYDQAEGIRRLLMIRLLKGNRLQVQALVRGKRGTTPYYNVFMMKRRLRQGARLIVVDPRKIGLVKSARIRADHHLAVMPGTNVPIVNALAHVVVNEGLVDEQYVAERCDTESFEAWKAMILKPENSPQGFVIRSWC